MKYRPELDGLRAIAVVPVILFHAGAPILKGGYLGVDIFFVISGYLLTKLMTEECLKGEFSLAKFYFRRIKRIFPVLYFILLLSIPVSYFCLLPDEMLEFSKSVLSSITFSANIFFYKSINYFDSASEFKPLIHIWSLALEEQFYILYPALLIVLIRRFKAHFHIILPVFVILILVGSSIAQYASEVKPSASFYLLPTRAWEFFVGAAVVFIPNACTEIKSRYQSFLCILGLAMIVTAMMLFNSETPTPGYLTFVPILGAALIIAYSSQKNIIGVIFGLKPFVFLGVLSYGAYLWHQPLFAFSRHLGLEGVTYFYGLSICSFVAAYFTWRYIETPFRQIEYSNKLNLYIKVSITALILVVLSIIGIATDGNYFRKFDLHTSQIISVRKELKSENICWKRLANNGLSSACEIGDKNVEKSFVLLGDSHAGMLVRPLNDHAEKNKLSGWDYTYGSCLPLLFGKSALQDQTQITCNKLRGEFLEKLRAGKLPKTIILMGRWTAWIRQSRFDNGEGGVEYGPKPIWDFKSHDNASRLYVDSFNVTFADTVNEILKYGHRVVLVYPTPEMGWDVTRELMKRRLNGGNLGSSADASTSYALFKNRNELTYRMMDDIAYSPRIHKIRPAEEILCNLDVKQRCIAHQDGMPLYADDDHLSYFGSNLIVIKIINILTKE